MSLEDFALILRGIHENVDICQTGYIISSKLEYSLYSDVHILKYNIQVNKRSTKVKKMTKHSI